MAYFLKDAPLRAKILVVDDHPLNVQILERKLNKEGLDVIVAEDGPSCLEKVREEMPDLILLDIMMPGMDGTEVCQHLQEDEATRSIPIIFITAKSSREGKLEGLGMGAVDYITKPIDLDETMARVWTQLNYQQILRTNFELEQRLYESRQAAAVGAVTNGVAHNLNNLLGVAVGYLDLIIAKRDEPELMDRGLTLINQAVRRMVDLIRQLSHVAHRERLALRPTSLISLLEGSVERFNEENGSELEKDFRLELPVDFKFPANREGFESVIVKVLSNAWESYDEEATERPIWVATHVESEDETETPMLFIEVHDLGRGLPPDLKDNIFDAFITDKANVGRGLGLTVARHAARSMGGDLKVFDKPEGGVCSQLMMPARVTEEELV